MYDRVIKRVLAAQLAGGQVAALVLDGGVTMRVVGAALLAFWLTVAWIAARCPWNPASRDIAWIR